MAVTYKTYKMQERFLPLTARAGVSLSPFTCCCRRVGCCGLVRRTGAEVAAEEDRRVLLLLLLAFGAVLLLLLLSLYFSRSLVLSEMGKKKSLLEPGDFVRPPDADRYAWVELDVLGRSSDIKTQSMLSGIRSLTRIARIEEEEDDYELLVAGPDARICFVLGESSFFMYQILFSSIGVRLPFTDFECDLLSRLRVAPSQLHPTGWSFVHAFEIFCGHQGLSYSVSLFLWLFFPYVPCKSGGQSWISLRSRSGYIVFLAYDTWKGYKSKYFRVSIAPGNPGFRLDNQGRPQFPLHWSGEFYGLPSSRYVSSWDELDETDRYSLAYLLGWGEMCGAISCKKLLECEPSELGVEIGRMAPNDYMIRLAVLAKVNAGSQPQKFVSKGGGSRHRKRKQTITPLDVSDQDVLEVQPLESEDVLNSIVDRGAEALVRVEEDLVWDKPLSSFFERLILSDNDERYLNEVDGSELGAHLKSIKHMSLRMASLASFIEKNVYKFPGFAEKCQTLQTEVDNLKTRVVELEGLQDTVARLEKDNDRLHKEFKSAEAEWCKASEVSFKNTVDQVVLLNSGKVITKGLHHLHQVIGNELISFRSGKPAKVNMNAACLPDPLVDGGMDVDEGGGYEIDSDDDSVDHA
ncbi:hypothetical protein RIF29_05115 [Crotalaria pallida]|uniref:Transposase (putative) gypsy type domain-containing protein n=1 Tax=Crotalaria pallida TaxID=3830 RepID=A0AAN9J490_CROPI